LNQLFTISKLPGIKNFESLVFEVFLSKTSEFVVFLLTLIRSFMKKEIFIISLMFFCILGILRAQIPEVGQMAPEIVLKNPMGKEIALSSLKGQMVLVDFWASWCGPCRKESPYLVDAYKDFRDSKFEGGRGFTIFSVSLDVKRDSWERAIETDSLIWENHVSDLKGWRNAAAQEYGVKRIPSNFLIDEEGRIVARNLRGPQLIEQLKKLKKNCFVPFWNGWFSKSNER
jgi:thiol-disulfide isomerase/thioredoxin